MTNGGKLRTQQKIAKKTTIDETIKTTTAALWDRTA